MRTPGTIDCQWEVALYPEASGRRLHVTMFFTNPVEVRQVQRFYEGSLRLLEERDLRSLVRRLDAATVAEWIGKRAPRFGIPSIQSVTVRTIPPAGSGAGHWSAEQAKGRRRTKHRHSRNGVRNALGPYQTRVSLAGRPAPATTARDWVAAEKIAAATRAHIVTPVCPPYEKQTPDGRLSGYSGLHGDAFADPRSYNSRYDYRGQLAGLATTAALLAGAGFPAPQGVVLVADWALIDLPGVRRTLHSDAEVLARLGAFAASLRQLCARDYPGLCVLTLRELGVSSHLPLGFSADPSERHSWLRDEAARGGLSWIEGAVLAEIIEVDDDRLVAMLDWRRYDDGVSGRRGALITLLQTYRSIAWVRAKEQLDRAVDWAALVAEEARQTRRFAYYDALLRYVTYQLCAALVTRQVGPSVCIYQDQALTVAGSCLRREGFPVLFLDPGRLREAPIGFRLPQQVGG